MKPLEKIDLMTTRENIGRILMHMKVRLFLVNGEGVSITTSADVIDFAYLHLPRISPIHEITKDIEDTAERFAA